MSPTPRRATQHSIVTTTWGARRRSRTSLTALQAAVNVRACRADRHRVFDAVHLYDTTDRTGARLLIAYARFQPGTWDDTADWIEVYEIPTDALTDL